MGYGYVQSMFLLFSVSSVLTSSQHFFADFLILSFHILKFVIPFWAAHAPSLTCSVGDQCQVVHDHNRPVNVYQCDPKVGSKHAHIVNLIVVYDQLEMGQVAIFLIHQAIKMKGLDHHLLCIIQSCMNSVPVDEIPKF